MKINFQIIISINFCWSWRIYVRCTYATCGSNFFQKERANILNGVAERNLCARLALYIELEMERIGLQGYYADVEYNRKQNGAVKTIMDDEYQIIRINCDLILHSRGEIIQRDNLIAVEMKKIERPQYEKIVTSIDSGQWRKKLWWYMVIWWRNAPRACMWLRIRIFPWNW